MEVAVVTGLFAKWDVDVDARHDNDLRLMIYDLRLRTYDLPERTVFETGGLTFYENKKAIPQSCTKEHEVSQRIKIE
jgi:hypothetical protein